VLINTLSGRTRAKFIVFGMLAGALFTGIVATLGGHFVWENGAHYAIFNALGIAGKDLYSGPTTPDLEWPTWIVYSAIPLGSSLMCFRFLQVTVSFIKTGELPQHDHGHVDGIDEDTIPAEVTLMDDDLHPHDLTHDKRDPAAKVGADGTAAGDKGDAK
jgi:C4-dicarboxylate transporter DctQ subunit